MRLLGSLSKALWVSLFGKKRPEGRSFIEHLQCLVVRTHLIDAQRKSIDDLRSQMGQLRLSSPGLKKVDLSDQIFDGISCVVAVPKFDHDESELDSDRVLLFLHGGAYVLGSARSYQSLMADIATSTRCQAIAPDYGLAPENAFPGPQNQCVQVARAVLNQYPDKKLVVVGDSAGGALAINVVNVLLNEGGHSARDTQSVDCLVLLSPWVEPTVTDGSMQRNAESDFLTQVYLQNGFDCLMQGQDPYDVRVNFAKLPLSFLPRTLVQFGDAEMFQDQILTFIERAKQQGVDITSESYQGQCHNFHLFTSTSAVSRQAMARIGEYVRAIRNAKTDV